MRGILFGLLVTCMMMPGASMGQENSPPGASGAGQEDGCDGHYTVMDDCSFLARQTPLEFVAFACSLGTPANCYGPSVVHLEVFVDGEQVADCLGAKRFESLAPAHCGGETEVPIGSDIECRVTGTAQDVLDPRGYYSCRTTTG